MRIGIAAAALVMTLTSGGAAAQDAGREAEEAAKQEKKICRTTKMTGSLTRQRRTCLTATEWRQLNDRTRKGLDELVGSASGAPRCISPADVACGTT